MAQCTGKNNLDSTITLSVNTNDSLSVLSRKSQVEQTTNVQETYSLIVFPNPNNGEFEIIIPNENGSLQITNINGIEIYSQLINIKIEQPLAKVIRFKMGECKMIVHLLNSKCVYIQY